MKKIREIKNKPQFERIELLDFKSQNVVLTTLSMLCAHARTHGTIYFQYVEGGTKYKLQVLEENL